MLSDVKYAWRSLLRSPGFLGVAVLTLALGSGATIAIFSLFAAALMRPPPFVNPQQLARIYSEFPNVPNGGVHRFALSEVEYINLRRQSQAWQSIEGWSDAGFNLGAVSGPMRIAGSFVTAGLLPLLGVPAELGRIITAQDRSTGTPVVVLSNALWKSAFAADRAIVGRDILLNGWKYQVIGVMPQGFRFALGGTDPRTDAWMLNAIDELHPRDNSHELGVVGRLKAGRSLAQARAELAALLNRWGQADTGHHLDPKEHPLVVYPLLDEVVRSVRPTLQVLFGAVCFLLLMACTNVANLLLTRTEGRQREIAIRGALGARITQLSSQFLAEGVVLSFLGTTLGLLFAAVSLKLASSANVGEILGGVDVGVDRQTLLFSITVTTMTSLVFALAPLWHLWRSSLHDAMKSTTLSVTGGVDTQRFRQMLIVGQLALAVILLLGTGLMLRAFWNLQRVDPGFDPGNLVTARVTLPDGRYSIEEAQAFWGRLESRLQRSPTQGAILAAALPPRFDTGWGFGTLIEGFVPTPGGPIPSSPGQRNELVPMIDFYQVVTPGYFDTLHIRLLAGRFFDIRDDARAPGVAIINETLARTIWGEASNALGRRLQPGGRADWATVVGVIADVKNAGVSKPAGTEVYFPYTQALWRGDVFMNARVAVRTHGDSGDVAASVRRAVHDIDPALPIVGVQTMTELMSAEQSRSHWVTMLLTAFAAVALLLASVGIYGVISYATLQRTRELGVRLALGAQRGNILSLLLGRGLLLVASGLIGGVLGSLALTHLLSDFLFGVTATDPMTYVAVSIFLGTIAMLAAYIPALRATRIDPLLALKAE